MQRQRSRTWPKNDYVQIAEVSRLFVPIGWAHSKNIFSASLVYAPIVASIATYAFMPSPVLMKRLQKPIKQREQFLRRRNGTATSSTSIPGRDSWNADAWRTWHPYEAPEARNILYALRRNGPFFRTIKCSMCSHDEWKEMPRNESECNREKGLESVSSLWRIWIRRY